MKFVENLLLFKKGNIKTVYVLNKQLQSNFQEMEIKSKRK